MKLKKIILDNIRSYEHQELEFPQGSTLLSGDIGSGKTSILLAIEFALFGLQPGQRGSSLLRNGKNEAMVKIEFESEGKEIMIERTLKKAKSISQDYCSITINGEKKEMSVTELKNKVLELLNYPKEFSKKQNILYKFTVYTPQEEMKQIILQDSVTRINTLRHVFGIDKYKKILENSSIIASKIREEKRLKEGITETLEQDKLNLVSKEDELESKHYNLSSVEKELFYKKENRKKIQDEKNEIFKKTEEKNRFMQEIEKTKLIVSNKKDLILSNQKSLENLTNQIKELEDLRFDNSQITETITQIESSKKQRAKFSEENLGVNSEINSLDYKNEENRKIEQKFSNLEICPTCLQNVDSLYRANVLNQIHSNISENNRKLEDFEEKRKQIEQEIKKIDAEISVKEKILSDLNILKFRVEGIDEKQIRIQEIEKMNILLENDMNLLDNHLKNLENSVLELEKFDKIFETKQKELDEALKEEKLAEIKVAELKKEIEMFSKQIEELREKTIRAEQIKKQMNYLNELENWISKKFVPLISLIEKNVMIKLKTEFSESFSEWFNMLVSDSFNIRLSNDFTPIIEQQDYEIDYQYLSGGERTAVALAYRLSLNQVINSLLSKIKTRDIVILDEPTDGFSDQQIDKMREVFGQLNVKQLIIVSHEPKIESFVENVIRFKKENGVSRRE